MKLFLLLFCVLSSNNAFAWPSTFKNTSPFEDFYKTPLHVVGAHTTTQDIKSSEILIGGRKGIAAPTLSTKASSVTISVPASIPLLPKPVIRQLHKMDILGNLGKVKIFNVMMLPMGKDHAFYPHPYVFPEAPDMLFQASANASVIMINDRGNVLRTWSGKIRTDIDADGWTGMPAHNKGGGISLDWLDLDSPKERGFYVISKTALPSKKVEWCVSYFFLGAWVPGNFKTVRDVLDVRWRDNAYFNRAAHNFTAMMGKIDPKYKVVYGSLPGAVKIITAQIAKRKKEIAEENARKKAKLQALKKKQDSKVKVKK